MLGAQILKLSILVQSPRASCEVSDDIFFVHLHALMSSGLVTGLTLKRTSGLTMFGGCSGKLGEGSVWDVLTETKKSFISLTLKLNFESMPLLSLVIELAGAYTPFS
jgi:hypothetical protein